MSGRHGLLLFWRQSGYPESLEQIVFIPTPTLIWRHFTLINLYLISQNYLICSIPEVEFVRINYTSSSLKNAPFSSKCLYTWTTPKKTSQYAKRQRAQIYTKKETREKGKQETNNSLQKIKIREEPAMIDDSNYEEKRGNGPSIGDECEKYWQGRRLKSLAAITRQVPALPCIRALYKYMIQIL